MEADLQHYYRVDLRDLWGGGLTMRRLKVLLDGLPPDSLWSTAIRRTLPPPKPGAPAADVDAVRWGIVHELLAALIDSTNRTAWTVLQVNSKKKIAQPEPFARPGTGRNRRALSAHNRTRIDGWIRASRAHSEGGEHGG